MNWINLIQDRNKCGEDSTVVACNAARSLYKLISEFKKKDGVCIPTNLDQCFSIFFSMEEPLRNFSYLEEPLLVKKKLTKMNLVENRNYSSAANRSTNIHAVLTAIFGLFFFLRYFKMFTHLFHDSSRNSKHVWGALVEKYWCRILP